MEQILPDSDPTWFEKLNVRGGDDRVWSVALLGCELIEGKAGMSATTTIVTSIHTRILLGV